LLVWAAIGPIVADTTQVSARFERLGIFLKPDASLDDLMGVLNPASARLRDGSLRLYPRMVAAGNVSRIGSFPTRELTGAVSIAEQQGFALEPAAPYEFREQPGGHGCEDPRVTFIAAIDRYVMAYVAFGPTGPQVALAVSEDGIAWKRLGLVEFRDGEIEYGDKDAAFFPEPVRSPAGVMSLAFYHRPTLATSILGDQRAIAAQKTLPEHRRECISIAYVPLDPVKASLDNLCIVTESLRLDLPPADWGRIKTGAGTPPVRIREGWLSVIHGVDDLEHPSGSDLLRYCAGIIIHDAERLDQIVYRSPSPLIVPEVDGEMRGTVNHVVFPTAIDPRGARVFDIYYGMADYLIGHGRLTLSS
jgi:predicted GH43/DUF377 family glycosyl hydrolase